MVSSHSVTTGPPRMENPGAQEHIPECWAAAEMPPQAGLLPQPWGRATPPGEVFEPAVEQNHFQGIQKCQVRPDPSNLHPSSQKDGEKLR